jgi:hypothetical protein
MDLLDLKAPHHAIRERIRAKILKGSRIWHLDAFTKPQSDEVAHESKVRFQIWNGFHNQVLTEPSAHAEQRLLTVAWPDFQ